MKKIKFVSVLFFLSAIQVFGASVIVVSGQSTVGQLSRNDVHDIFMGTQGFWSDGSRIRLARLGDFNKSTEELMSKVLELPLDKFLSIWRRKMFSGRGFAPVVFETPVELRSWIMSTESSAGVLPASEVGQGLKIVYSF